MSAGSRIPVLRHRPDVRFNKIAPAGFRILAALDKATKVIGFDLEITSGTDSHTSGQHPLGQAYDVSVKGMTIPVIARLKKFLQQELGERFTVLYEVPDLVTDADEALIAYVNPDASGKHLHLQVRKGTVYPPTTNVAYV